MDERGVLPLGVIRDGRIAFANAKLASYLGYTREEMIGQPLEKFVAARDHERVLQRHQRRLLGETVPESYELELLRKDGTSRHAEIYIAISGEDVSFELADRTHLARRRANLRELARLGATLQNKHAEADIFATLGNGLLALGIAWGRVVPDNGDVVIVDVATPDGSLEKLEREANISLRGMRAPWGAPARHAWEEGSDYIDDLPLASFEFFGAHTAETGVAAREISREGGLGRAIILRIDVAQKPWQLLFVMADWLLEEDLASFGLLRIQVSAALDAARVIADLSARNDELAALNEIGAAAGGGELRVLFEVMSKAVVRLLGPKWLTIYLFEGDSADARLAFQAHLPADILPAIERITGPNTMFERVRMTGKTTVWRFEDMPIVGQQRLAPIRFDAAVSIPLVAAARVIGMLTAAWDHRDVLPEHLEFLQATAAHFAAAVRAKTLVDDLRKSYADLARTQEQLVQRERLAALGELAAIVAHEIRNPLGAVFNAIGAIRRQAHNQNDEHLSTLIAILEEEATRMNDIVGDLLDFARPVSAALRPERIETIVSDAIDAATHDALGPIRVEREVASDLPAVPIDSRLLRQAILNVGLNAVQALGPRGGTIHLRIDQEKDGALRIEIADDGPGIASEHQARVFEPFFTTRPSGTGLGLTVVKRIVDVHHGETSLRTESGKGTTFTIRLPVPPPTSRPIVA